MICNYDAVRLDQDELNSNSVSISEGRSGNLLPISAESKFKTAGCFAEGAMVERFSGSDYLRKILRSLKKQPTKHINKVIRCSCLRQLWGFRSFKFIESV